MTFAIQNMALDQATREAQNLNVCHEIAIRLVVLLDRKNIWGGVDFEQNQAINKEEEAILAQEVADSEQMGDLGNVYLEPWKFQTSVQGIDFNPGQLKTGSCVHSKNLFAISP